MSHHREIVTVHLKDLVVLLQSAMLSWGIGIHLGHVDTLHGETTIERAYILSEAWSYSSSRRDWMNHKGVS